MSVKVFWTVQIEYRTIDNGISVFRITNLTADKLYQFRSDVVTHGAKRTIDDGTYEVVLPWNILSFMCYRQEYFFNAGTENKPLTRSTN